MKSTSTLIISIFILTVLVIAADARMFRVNQIPNGSKFNCQSCHVSPNGGGTLTPFGLDVENNLNGSNVNWSPALANLDSDNDGFTNGQELLDPDGTWKSGTQNPGNLDNAGNPGDNKSTPLISSIENMIASQMSVSPNPVNSSALFNFYSSREINGNVRIINLNGVTLNLLHKGLISAGEFRLYFNPIDFSGNRLPRGTYLIVISSENQQISKKLIIE